MTRADTGDRGMTADALDVLDGLVLETCALSIDAYQLELLAST